MTESRKPVLLAILDGWGIGRDEPGNAVLAANTPVMDRLMETYPHATLLTSGENVGLPAGQMGNSEVGHLNIGAGYIVYQWISRLNRAIADHSFATNQAFVDAFNRVKTANGTLHMMGLIGDGGVHAHTEHMLALLDAAEANGVRKILVHAFTDGRDTSPTSGAEFIKPIEARLASMPEARVATVIGRYFAMDRDHRWERTKKAFDAIIHGEGTTAPSAPEAIQASYDAGVTDEFIDPAVILDAEGNRHRVGEGDEFIFWNFRSDRGRQLSQALIAAGVQRLRPGRLRPLGSSPHHHDDLRGELAGHRRLPAGGRRVPARARPERGRQGTVPHRRDREIPARDVLH